MFVSTITTFRSRLIRASWHQGNAIFNPLYMGKQCTTIALAAILKANCITPSHWNTNILIQILTAGDELYEAIQVHSTATGVVIPESGYLLDVETAIFH